MAMGPLHRFARRLLWRLVAVLVLLLVATRVLGPGTTLLIVEWTPMAVALLLAAGHVGQVLRGLHHERARRRRF
jgi:hypothetical protein